MQKSEEEVRKKLQNVDFTAGDESTECCRGRRIQI